MGRRGVVDCSFHEQFYGVVWYTANGYEEKESLLRLIDGEKEGDGYSSGDFDILLDGSLVIANVTLQHDQIFYVLKFASESDVDPFLQEVRIIVTVRPALAYPIVSQCENINKTCFKQLYPGKKVSCFVKDARPAVSLAWMIRTAEEDVNIPSVTSVVGDGPLFTSIATTSYTFPYSSLLSLLVCEAKSVPGMLLHNETVVFIESSEVNISSLKPLKKYVGRGSRMELRCSEDTISLIVWQKSWEREGIFEIIALAALFDGGFSLKYVEEYQLSKDGILAVPLVDVRHEGLYGCVSQNHNNVGNMIVFDVIVYVTAYPTFHGCQKNQRCVLEGEKEGRITCSVKGVRPIVNLELETLNEKDSSLITFTNKEVTISDNTNTYDVYLTSKYHVNELDVKPNQILPITCKIVGPNIEFFKAQTTFNLSFAFGKFSFFYQN
ncbi:hypothetical protein HOLleu_01332 [Holothuria leucospilota]|uniref:Ig-like domain-containing protein n=1 Tax=Holothuria leucospilota TaxID=206669 RepID=A0A9Q1CNA7_HOLLE|nr:hypothetical protein HOLleu_01332 [Holothuria leucospilota]